MRPSDDVVEEWPAGLLDLYRRDFVSFVRVAYLIVGDRMVAEEIVQDTFINCARRWEAVERPAAYVRVAVANAARSRLRARRTERRLLPDAPPAVEVEVDELWDALQQLDDRKRTAIVLRYYCGLPDVEIAQVLGCRRSTVRSLVRRGVLELRKEIVR